MFLRTGCQDCSAQRGDVFFRLVHFWLGKSLPQKSEALTFQLSYF